MARSPPMWWSPFHSNHDLPFFISSLAGISEYTRTSLKFWFSRLSLSSPWEWFYLCRREIGILFPHGKSIVPAPFIEQFIPSSLIVTTSVIYWVFPKASVCFWSLYEVPQHYFSFPILHYTVLITPAYYILLSEMASPLILFLCQTVLVFYPFIPIMGWTWFALLTRIVEAIQTIEYIFF